MRIALTGTHRVGKTTLARAIADALPDHDLAEEPYHEMAGDGYVFSHPPDAEDFEAQLEHSLASLSDGAPDVIFDRCPVDLLAYLLVESEYDEDVIARWREPVRRAMRSLDGVILVSIETPDVIDFRPDEDSTGSRRAVDETVRELLLGSRLELEVELLEVSGSVDRRATETLEWLDGSSAERSRAELLHTRSRRRE